MSASRQAQLTIRFVDEYCQLYEELFPEVRSFEAFKLLQLGMISEINCKSLPAIAKAVGLDNQQSLRHFLTESPWSVGQLRQKQLELILKVFNDPTLILLIMRLAIARREPVPITSNANISAMWASRKMELLPPQPTA